MDFNVQITQPVMHARMNVKTIGLNPKFLCSQLNTQIGSYAFLDSTRCKSKVMIKNTALNGSCTFEADILAP